MQDQSSLHPWLNSEQLQMWVKEAPDKARYQQRLAVWLTHLGGFAAQRIAEMLAVSPRVVAKWLSDYNRLGPVGSQRKGRGGRRWGLLSLEDETKLLADYVAQAPDESSLTAKRLQGAISRDLGRRVSLGYVYALLHRHHWSRTARLRAMQGRAEPTREAEREAVHSLGS